MGGARPVGDSSRTAHRWNSLCKVSRSSPAHAISSFHANELWNEPQHFLSLGGRLCRPDTHGRQAGRSTVQQATTFETVLNLKAARALGLTSPMSILRRARRGDRMPKETLREYCYPGTSLIGPWLKSAAPQHRGGHPRVSGRAICGVAPRPSARRQPCGASSYRRREPVLMIRISCSESLLV